MGTGKPGRYVNTVGTHKSMSAFARTHISEGTFNKPRHNKGDNLRLVSGGHGQKSIELLEKYGIKYNILKTFSNGVRTGNIPSHDDKRKRTGSNQVWFPKSWSERKIQLAAEHVAKLKRYKNWPDGKMMIGHYKGVRLAVILRNHQIATAFPTNEQS